MTVSLEYMFAEYWQGITIVCVVFCILLYILLWFLKKAEERIE